MTDAKQVHPHSQAAFINAIRDEGTKTEACNYLQHQWNENCVLRAEVKFLSAERDAWKSQCEAVQREAEKCFSAQEDIDAAWDAFGTSGNREVLSLAEQIASHQREVDDARSALQQSLAAQAAEIARWQSVAIGPLSAAAIIATKDAEIARLLKALADIIPTNRLHGVTPDSAGKQIWFDGPSASIARAALEGTPK